MRAPTDGWPWACCSPLVLLGLVLGVPVGLFVESTMDLVEAQWP